MRSKKTNTAYRSFLLGYVLFYILMQFSFSMQASMAEQGMRHWMVTGVLGLVNAFLPFFVLQKWHPSSYLKTTALLVLSIILSVLLHLLAAHLVLSLSFNGFFDTSYRLLVTLCLYGIGFYFVRYSHLKAVEAKELEARQKETEVDWHQQVFSKEHILGRLAQIERMVKASSPSALHHIEQLSDELQQMVYSLNKRHDE